MWLWCCGLLCFRVFFVWVLDGVYIIVVLVFLWGGMISYVFRPRLVGLSSLGLILVVVV